MNQTAKKLREEADFMSGVAVSAAETIVMARNIFGIEPTDTFGGDLGRVLETIADELDELQARAVGASNLRQQLESAEKKAERRKQHIEYLETALHDKNALLEQRGGTIARLTAERSGLRKQVPSERERQILDMWPRFEDGEYVWFGDEFLCRCGKSHTCDGVRVQNTGEKVIFAANHPHAIFLKDGSEYDERVKRPAPKVLDADGVEIKAGDTVWCRNLCTKDFTSKATVVGFYEHRQDVQLVTLRDEMGWTCHIDPKKITHVQPDSWERLEEDAEFNDETGIVGGNLDIVRRAKALAGVEVAE